MYMQSKAYTTATQCTTGHMDSASGQYHYG